jgi:ribosome biogenesis GTPase / thiamine phosphate phosphatase
VSRSTEATSAGLITKAQSGFYTVDIGGQRAVCQLRGKVKRGKATGDLAALGDHVQVHLLADGSGVIDAIEERKHSIVRLDPRPRGAYQQVLLANVDQAVFVFSCAHPEPRLRMLDRFLVIAEKQGVPAIIVANKTDLVSEQVARGTFSRYRAPGYPVIYTSARTGAGVEELSALLKQKISVLAGPSGAGKSSLLNTIRPGLGLIVNELSAVDKGQHTTVVRELFSLGDGRSYVADTPGWKSLALWDTQPQELDAYFPEIKPLVAKCRFSDCSHTHEPDCAVRAAVETGGIHPERYESYIRLRAGQD